jgi:hypothetical protein
MEAHQERVVQEKWDLDLKVQKLEQFIDGEIHSNLVEDEKKRLAAQLHHMKEYSKILAERISAF